MNYALKEPKIDKEMFDKELRIKGNKMTNPVINTKIKKIEVKC